MELVQFHDRLYGKYKTHLYVFEPTWDSFRPITKVAWNGSQYEICDQEFKTNLFSEDYGYGSLEQRQICRVLTQETELGNPKELTNSIDFWKWCGEINVKWWRDRPVVFTSKCVSKEINDWKKYLMYLNTKAKTLRRPFKGRLTRRLVPK